MLRRFIRNELITGKSELLKRYAAIQFVSKSNIRASSSDKSNKNEEDDELNKPIKYSTSKAATWKALHTRVPPSVAPPYQSFVVTASLFVFCLYFMVLREENDLDLLITRSMNENQEQFNKNKQ